MPGVAGKVSMASLDLEVDAFVADRHAFDRDLVVGGAQARPLDGVDPAVAATPGEDVLALFIAQRDRDVEPARVAARRVSPQGEEVAVLRQAAFQREVRDLPKSRQLV